MPDTARIKAAALAVVVVASPTVVIAYVAFGSPPATVEGALTEILANLG